MDLHEHFCPRWGLAQVKWSPWESIQIWIQDSLERFSPLQGRTKLDIWFYSSMKKNTYQTDTGNYCLKVLKTILHSNLGPDVLRNPGIQYKH